MLVPKAYRVKYFEDYKKMVNFLNKQVEDGLAVEVVEVIKEDNLVYPVTLVYMVDYEATAKRRTEFD